MMLDDGHFSIAYRKVTFHLEMEKSFPFSIHLVDAEQRHNIHVIDRFELNLLKAFGLNFNPSLLKIEHASGKRDECLLITKL